MVWPVGAVGSQQDARRTKLTPLVRRSGAVSLHVGPSSFADTPRGGGAGLLARQVALPLLAPPQPLATDGTAPTGGSHRPDHLTT